jgi:hypothetical protein
LIPLRQAVRPVLNVWLPGQAPAPPSRKRSAGESLESPTPATRQKQTILPVFLEEKILPKLEKVLKRLNLFGDHTVWDEWKALQDCNYQDARAFFDAMAAAARGWKAAVRVELEKLGCGEHPDGCCCFDNSRGQGWPPEVESVYLARQELAAELRCRYGDNWDFEQLVEGPVNPDEVAAPEHITVLHVCMVTVLTIERENCDNVHVAFGLIRGAHWVFQAVECGLGLTPPDSDGIDLLAAQTGQYRRWSSTISPALVRFIQLLNLHEPKKEICKLLRWRWAGSSDTVPDSCPLCHLPPAPTGLKAEYLKDGPNASVTWNAIASGDAGNGAEQQDSYTYEVQWRLRRVKKQQDQWESAVTEVFPDPSFVIIPKDPGLLIMNQVRVRAIRSQSGANVTKGLWSRALVVLTGTETLPEAPLSSAGKGEEE